MEVKILEGWFGGETFGECFCGETFGSMVRRCKFWRYGLEVHTNFITIIKNNAVLLHRDYLARASSQVNLVSNLASLLATAKFKFNGKNQ